MLMLPANDAVDGIANRAGGPLRNSVRSGSDDRVLLNAAPTVGGELTDRPYIIQVVHPSELPVVGRCPIDAIAPPQQSGFAKTTDHTAQPQTAFGMTPGVVFQKRVVVVQQGHQREAFQGNLSLNCSNRKGFP